MCVNDTNQRFSILGLKSDFTNFFYQFLRFFFEHCELQLCSDTTCQTVTVASFVCYC